MHCFQLLHLSDFHIAVQEKVLGFPYVRAPAHTGPGAVRPLSLASWNSQLFEELLTQVVSPCRGVLDAVLLTGDMSTDGNPRDMIHAVKQINRLVKALAAPTESIDEALDRVFLIPGNHDRYLGRWKRAGGTEFDRHFRRYWPRDGDGEVRRVLVRGLEASDETLFVISADLSLARTRHATGKYRGGHLGQGRVYPEIIRQMETLTEDARCGGYEVELTSWGDGSEVRPFGRNLMIVGIDDKLQLRIRIFGPTGDCITRDESQFPAAQLGAIHALKLRIASGLSWKPLSDEEKRKLVGDVMTIMGTSMLRRNPVVWSVHFPPSGETGFVHPSLRLNDEHLLLEACARAEVSHLFCGHTHVNKSYTLMHGDHSVNVYCAGTATQHYTDPDAPNCVHPVEIEVDGGAIKDVRWYTLGWDLTWGAFLPHREPKPTPEPRSYWPISVR